ncbi:hypothetical protein ATEIFO6365_0011046800 [Aspergillus terreus]|uniref:Uncharacterized protein n=1 Tax=Aspergillus terreus TaxID=33178 RepID=A0A5M3Z457_ASPTE|nr:hypothetical protein ATETN484_0006061000 [Aspergillus terreus]GFF20206.1 hypothetical protein ATEIFO6365_0011046800 [Aspergillus terreus]
MKFTGIAAALAVASTASAAALPAVPLDSAVSKLTSVLGNLDSLLGGVLGGTAPVAQLTEVKSELTNIKSMLGQCTSGVVKRELVDSLTKPVEGVAGSAVGTVTETGDAVTGSLGIRAGNDLSSLSGNIVQQVQSGVLDTAGLTNLLSLVQAGDLTSALGILNIL